MAAPSSSTKSSPSEKPLDGAARPSKTEADEAHTAPTVESSSPVAAAAAAPREDETEAVGLPTYESIQASQRHKVAKTLLDNGDFEDALVTIEEGLVEIKEQLLAANMSPEQVEFHPALGPYHYLYGTTLLYSVEESSADDGLQPVPQQEEGEDPTEDTQIAHENLDIARVVVERYLESLESGKKSDESTAQTKSVDALRLDLAQIRLREGDLHRLNGKYDEALQDYQACLDLRKASKELGPYDRKLADVHYNLGLVYSLKVAEASTTSSDPSATAAVAGAPTAAAASSDPETPPLSPQELDEARCKAAYHHLQCGRVLGGQLANYSGLDAKEFLRQVDAAMPSQKTTGEEGESHLDSPARCRLHLRTLREHVGNLPLDGLEHEMTSILEVLEELQETMDEAESAEAGVQQVASMKAAISAAAAASNAETTQGETSDGADAAPAAFGSQAASAVTATAQPVMAVRKKKRPPPSAADDKTTKQPKPSSE